MTTTATREETAIRERIEALAQALRAKDVDALMAFYAPDVVTFDVRPPLHVEGLAAYRKNFEAWFGAMQGPIDYRMSDLRISANGDVAFCHCLSHVRSTTTTGKQADYWVRVSSGLRKLNGQWMVAHEHISMPTEL